MSSMASLTVAPWVAQQPFAADWIVQNSQLIFQPVFRNVQAEVAGGHILDGVCLIENDHVIFGQIIDAGDSQGQIREEQGVIHHQDVSAVHPPLGGLPEAVVVKFAFFPKAVAVLGADALPDRRVRQRRHIRQRSIGRRLGPLLDEPGAIRVAAADRTASPAGRAPAPTAVGRENSRALSPARP